MMFHRRHKTCRTGKCDPGDTSQGSAARERAEKDLARVRSETPYYEGLGRDLRTLVERNHIADNIRATIRES